MLKRVRIPALLAAVLAACDTVQPAGEIRTGQGPQLDLFDPPLQVVMLQRTTSLSRDYTASAVIGRGGGTISIPEAGFSIVFPYNAIQGGQSTRITVKALAGRNVAYLFEPHGLVFQNTPVITQDLRRTEAYQNLLLVPTLEGVYFPDVTSLDGILATVLETRPTLVDPLGWKMRFSVQHFSGYAASSRRSGYISSSGNLVPFGN